MAFAISLIVEAFFTVPFINFTPRLAPFLDWESVIAHISRLSCPKIALETSRQEAASFTKRKPWLLT